ncbi:Gfo/Idh/MocA family oxidoreductase [Luteolibacter sp. Populi]|uniref:Gfo/Idh/MocA family oxidoreductase n=1 Tax=Luteolibacter sp. Populi TaxID=3230487 RepID=UPI0034673899
METIRAGVAGAGSMGRNHARVYSLIPEAKLCGIYDADFARAQAIAEEFGTVPVASLEELSQLAEAVSVAVPTVAHRDVGCRLMDLGCHILMEKPIAPSVADAQVLVETAKRHGKILQVGHIERFNPVLRQLEQRLTHPKFIEAHRLSPFPNRSIDIGVVLDLMIHDLEIILHLVRSPIESIDAVGVPVLTLSEDIANARIRFANGCVANVTASRISPEKMRKIRVFQSDCYLSLDYQEQAGQIHWREGMSIQRAEVEVEKGEPLKLELAAFIASVAHGHDPAVTGQQGTAALELAIEITRIIHAQG